MQARAHIATVVNGGPIIAICIWAAEIWVPQRFPEGWNMIPWGLITLGALCVWIGFHLSDLQRGTHIIQRRLLPALRPVQFSEIKWREDPNNQTVVAAYIEIEAKGAHRNALTTADIFYEEHYVSGTTGWVQQAHLKFQGRQDLNPGDVLVVTLVKAPRANHVLDGRPTDPQQMARSGLHRVVIRFTSHRGRFVREYPLWVTWGFGLLPIPFDPSLDLSEKGSEKPEATAEVQYG